MTKGKGEDCKIHIAFRFHANLYHSYRADTPDEDGIGKDIRIIRYCLDILDKYNDQGIPVKGTWDIENYYSLELNMRKFCPEIIERIKKRVSSGYDEVELMNYDNGIISAHTEEEALENIRRAITNQGGSGLKDVFGTYAPIVRPQECMMTPSLISLYKKVGIEAFSVYYSCIPFNGFSNFVPLLSTRERYNPLYYTAPGVIDKITVIPAINPGDVYDNFGITNLVRNLRKEQLNMDDPVDMLVLLDMDADDDFWQGYINTGLSFGLKCKKPLWDGGLNIFIKKLCKLPYVIFNTPYAYLKTHSPIGTVSVGQDTADGSFDGYSPWSDKLENTKLWTGIDRTRLLSQYALSLSDNDKSIIKEIEKSMTKRLLTTSTTHFGLSTPVMCKPRLNQAFDMVKGTLATSNDILNQAKSLKPLEEKQIKAIIPNKYYRGKGSKKGLIRVKADENICLSGKGVTNCFYREVFGKRELNLIYEGKESIIELTKDNKEYNSSVYCLENSIGNKHIKLTVQINGELELKYNDILFTNPESFKTSINYDNKIIYSTDIDYSYRLIENNAAFIIERGKLIINEKEKQIAEYTKSFMIAGDLPYLYVDMDIIYPLTADYKTNKHKVRKLQRGYDIRWKEIMPLEIIPNFNATTDNPIRVYKHNFIGDLSYYDYNYSSFNDNKNIDASNNAITCGLISYVAKDKGLLLAQSVASDNNFAFVRVRLRNQDEIDIIRLNPFGVYGGKQLKYKTARYGIAQKMAIAFAESYMSCAPTFRGGRQQFSLMIAPFNLDKPNDELINDAIMYAYPPYIYSSYKDIDMIDFTEWENYEPINK